MPYLVYLPGKPWRQRLDLTFFSWQTSLWVEDKLAISDFFRLEAPEYFQFYYTMMHPTPGRQLLGERAHEGKSAVCRSIWKISARVCRLLQHPGHSGLTKPTLALLFKWQLQIWSAATSKQTPKVHSEKGWGCTPTQGHHCLGFVSAGQKPWRSTNPEEYRPESLDQSKLQFPEGIRTFINTHAFRMRTPSEIPRYCWLAPQSGPHPLGSPRMQRNKWGFASSLVYGFKIGNLEIPQISYKSRYLGPRMLSSHLRFGMSECPSRISVRTTDWGIFWHCSLRAKLKADKINLKKKTTAHFN